MLKISSKANAQIKKQSFILYADNIRQYRKNTRKHFQTKKKTKKNETEGLPNIEVKVCFLFFPTQNM